MNIFEKSGAASRMQALMSEKQIVTEINEDFSLPDYQPEIKRLLRVRATVSFPDTYMGAGNAECSGTIDYCILYSGNDGALYCTNQTGEYRFSSPLELPRDFEVGEGVICDVESAPEMLSGRVIAPRRLAVKCRLRSCVRLYGTRVIGEQVQARDGLECLHGECEGARIFLGVGEPVRLADEILCDVHDGERRVIFGEGQVFVTEAIAGSGGVNCRGELCLKLLCSKENGEEGEMPQVILRRIPFSQTVNVDGVEVNCDACARGICSELNITVEEGRILCEATISLSARAQRNERVTFVRDLYSTAQSCEVSYASVKFPTALKCLNGNFSLNTTLSREEVGLRQGMVVLDAAATATVASPEADRGKYYLNGKCRIHAVLMESGELTSQEFEVPFRYECEGSQAVPVAWDVTAEVISCRVRLDGERVGVDAEIALAAALRGETERRLVSEVAFGEAWHACGSVCTVCYPSREDTLWSVARRYHCPSDSLAERNALANAPAADAEDSLAGVKFLLI